MKAKLIVLESDGTPSVCDLAYLVKQTEKNRGYLDYKTLLLPENLGAVPLGMFHSGQGDPGETMDVADAHATAKRIRFLFVGEEGATRLPRGAATDAPPASENRADLVEYAASAYKWPLKIEHPTDEGHCLVYFGARPAETRGTPADVPLDQHQKSVAAKAKSLANKVGLHWLEETYGGAGDIHDSGKNRDVWQRAMGGTKDKPLAKTKSPVNLRLIDGYRHELGSLIDAVLTPEGPTDDLLLHFVASHHAGARPHFETRQYDRQNLMRSAQECPEIARRYARLQAKYGAWGLAYLEAVFKSADGIVSSEEGESASA